jgi:hypothetical protein
MGAASVAVAPQRDLPDAVRSANRRRLLRGEARRWFVKDAIPTFSVALLVAGLAPPRLRSRFLSKASKWWLKRV